MPSLGSSRSAYAGWRWIALPSRRIPTRLLREETVQAAVSRSSRSHQSARGPGIDVEHDLALRHGSAAAPPRRPGTPPAPAPRAARHRRPADGRAHAATGCRSTASRAPVAPRCRRAPRATCADPGRGLPRVSTWPSARAHGRGVRDRPPVDVRRARRAGQRDEQVAAGADRQAAERDLERGRALRVRRLRPRAGARRGAARAGMPPGRLRRSGPLPRRRDRAAEVLDER